MLEYENFIKIIAFIMISKYFFYLISFSTKKFLFQHWIIFCWCSYYFLYFIKFLENSFIYWSYEDYHYAIIKFDFFFFWSIKKNVSLFFFSIFSFLFRFCPHEDVIGKYLNWKRFFASNSFPINDHWDISEDISFFCKINLHNEMVDCYLQYPSYLFK